MLYMQTQRRRSLHIGKTYDQHLEACCRGISYCYAVDNPKLTSSHWHCYQYLNGAKLRLSYLLNDDSRCRTARCSLTSYPRKVGYTILSIQCNLVQGRRSIFVHFSRSLQQKKQNVFFILLDIRSRGTQ